MAMHGKGWFNTAGRPGDRSLDQQLIGLDPLLAEAAGKTILDIGCAEGLISIELAHLGGARHVHGIEIVPGHIDIAKQLAGDLPCEFEVADANNYLPTETYDIVIALALLHKLRDPSAAATRFARHARSLVVLRLPPENAPIIIDARSGNVPHDISLAMHQSGFALERLTSGPFNEWCGYWRRVV